MRFPHGFNLFALRELVQLVTAVDEFSSSESIALLDQSLVKVYEGCAWCLIGYMFISTNEYWPYICRYIHIYFQLQYLRGLENRTLLIFMALFIYTVRKMKIPNKNLNKQDDHKKMKHESITWTLTTQTCSSPLPCDVRDIGSTMFDEKLSRIAL